MFFQILLVQLRIATNEKFYTHAHAQGLKDYCHLFNKLTIISTSNENFDLK
jgi:hypothetical protein